MSKGSSLHTYVNDDGFELTAVPDSQQDLVLRENPQKWARVVERPTSRRSKATPAAEPSDIETSE